LSTCEFGTDMMLVPVSRRTYVMPISVTVPSSGPPSAPARSWTASPTRNGRASSSTMPANTLDSACCAAIPTKTLVSAPPRTSWPTGTENSSKVMTKVANPPASSSAYLTTAACEGPVRGSSTVRAFPDSPMVAALPRKQKATAQPAAMTWLGTSSGAK
jgi:hypothetical protein